MELIQARSYGALHGLIHSVDQPVTKALGCYLNFLLESIQTLNNSGHLLADWGKSLCWVSLL